MKYPPETRAPTDAPARRAAKPVIVYPPQTLPTRPIDMLKQARQNLLKTAESRGSPRDRACFHVPAGHFFRIRCVDGSQVGDLNLWNADNLDERFYSGKTRALHGSHLSTGDSLWSSFPHLRAMATISHDTLDWYGWDQDGASVHDVIGTRCDPYTNHLLSGADYHWCCHSNLTRALAAKTGLSLQAAEPLVHDVLNVFMCTGFTHDTHQYFMKASPVRAGDYLEYFAEIDLLVGLSACPGGDCASGHSDERAQCHPLLVEVFAPQKTALKGWQSPHPNGYDQSHGCGENHDRADDGSRGAP